MTHSHARTIKIGQKRKQSVCGKTKMDRVRRIIHVFRQSSPERLFKSSWHTHTQKQKWSVRKGRSLNAIKKKLIVRGWLYIDWNRHCLNASLTAPDTYPRNKINGLSEKTRVCMRPKKKDGARRIIHEFKNIAWTPLQMFLTHTHAKKNQSVRKGWSLYAVKKKRVCAADHTSIQIGIAWTPLQLLVPRSHATTKQVGQKLGGWMRSNKNWMCAADYTCILICIVWTPFLLSVTHTHAIKKMVWLLKSLFYNKDMQTTISFLQTHYVIIFVHSNIILCTQPIK